VPVIAGRFQQGSPSPSSRCVSVGGWTGVTTVGLTGEGVQNMTLHRLTVEGVRNSG